MKKLRFHSARVSLDSLESRFLLSAASLAAVHPGHDQTATHLTVTGKPQGPGTSITAPTNVVASDISATQVSISWNPSSGASGYYLYRSSKGGRYSKIATISGSTSAYTDSSVAASTSYSYYLVAYVKNAQSSNSNVATVTTAPPAPVQPPSAPTNLAVAGTTTSSISLSWTDIATNESGYRVYRSTDGITFSPIASLAAGIQAYTDSGLPSGTAYYYEVGAWNSGGESDTAPITGSTDSSVPSGDPINIYSRYGGELVLAGTSSNDSIYVSQSGSTLTITSNGTTTTQPVPANGLFIYSDGGSDTITVDSSVTIRTTIATIDASGTSVSNADVNASVWIDSTDGFSGVGSLHKVASFYEGVSKTIGINIADPSDAGSTFRASASLWGAGPVMGDVNQGGVGDCYFVASLAAFANTIPAKLENMAVDLGDGTYAVQYMRGGTPTYVRVDGDMSSGGFGGYAFAHPGSSGDLWAMIMEKSYAYFRSGANSYASLNSGWMGDVYSDFGIANTNLSLGTTESSFYNTVSNALANGKPVTFGTPASPPNLVGSHAYTLVSVSTDGNGHTLYLVRNPWGFSGDSLEDGGGYATLTFAQMQANFNLGTIAT